MIVTVIGFCKEKPIKQFFFIDIRCDRIKSVKVSVGWQNFFRPDDRACFPELKNINGTVFR